LSSLSNDLASWGAKQKQKQDEEDALRGEAAFYEATQGGYAKGVADGIIPADRSPKFVEGYKRAMGMSAGISLDSYLGAEFNNWGDKTNPDPAAFDQWFRNTVKSRVTTQDPNVLRGLMPYLRASGQKYHSMWQSEVTQNTQNTALASYGAAIASTIDDAQSDAQQDGTTLNIDQLGANIDAIREHGQSIGLRNDQVDKLVADTIQVKALTSRDPTLLALFDRKSASGPPLGDTPYGVSVKAQVTSSLMRLWKTEESEARLQQERQDKLAANQAKQTIVEQILKDPNAPIDEQQLAPILKIDGNFKLDLLKWRDDIRTRNVTDDPAKVSSLYQDILAGGGDGMDKVTSAIRAGDVRNPENIRQAITFAKAMQDYGQRPDGILSTSAAKSYIGQIQLVGQDPKMSKNRVFGDPAMLTEDGRTALNNYRYGLMQWQTQNPSASPLERERYATDLGESILKHFKPVSSRSLQRTYTAPPSVQGQPQAQPLSIDQTPAAAAEVLQRMQGGGQPQPQAQVPSTPNQATQGTGQPISTSVPQQGATNPLYRAMSPEQRSAIEGLAKRKGLSVDDFLGGVKLPDKRSDASGGSLPLAAITPASLIETARSAARRLGLSGVISPNAQQQPQSPQTAETNPVLNQRFIHHIANSPVGPVIQRVAERLGFDPQKAMNIAYIESTGDPQSNRYKPTQYKGLYQLNPDEWSRYGNGGDIYDAESNAEAGIRSIMDKSARFTREFGHEPSVTELYLMHQQGEAGLRAHERNLDRPAWMNMRSTGEGRMRGDSWARKAIWGNVPGDMRHYFGDVDNITSRQFLAVWTAKLLGISYPQALAMNGSDRHKTTSEAEGNLEDETRG
jgi:hypothetical protein